MRVVAGEFRGRRLVAPAGLAVRPTPDRVREALFDIIGLEIRGSAFLDLFAGSGANGIEALSRGAARVAFVETGREALRSLERNLESLGISQRIVLCRTPWPGALHEVSRPGPFSIAFADPPFAEADYGKILESLSSPRVLGPEGLVIVEHEEATLLPEKAGELVQTRLARYGRVALAFYSRPI